MENVTITAQTLLALVGVIAAVGSATAVISRWLSPYKALKKTVEQHTRLLDNDLKRFEQVSKERDEDRETSRAQCRAILALLDHSITGNSVDKLKSARERLQEHLVEH